MKSLLRLIIFGVISISTFNVFSQSGSLNGKVKSEGQALPFCAVILFNDSIELGTSTGENGEFYFTDLPIGSYQLSFSSLGFEKTTISIDLNEGKNQVNDIELKDNWYDLNPIVITGTKSPGRNHSSPVIVDVIDSKKLDNTQSCVLSEGLKFQPGLRVETDCQTCNYTQLRMNGLGGGYSQILINGRPIFSPLTGLYGMEQIPSNMIEQIEIVRGGGSALYGSSAVGGVVNVITKIPSENNFNIASTYQNIKGTNDFILTGNSSLVSRNKKQGITLFLNQRKREAFDANGDHFSEIPELSNQSFGSTAFWKPSEQQKFEVAFSSINEYRYGGDLTATETHLARQAEERTHQVILGNLDYQYNFINDKASLIAFLAGQTTNREHYTGILPSDTIELESHIATPPYGTSENLTAQGGLQFNYRFTHFLSGSNTFTIGSEYVLDRILDEIPSYGYKVDQTTQNLGGYFQSNWDVFPKIKLLSGFRLDKHNKLNHVVISPRVSIMYTIKGNTQLRASWSTGFRAPQAFDTDLHIAFAGGGVSRIMLDPTLKEERSNTYSISINSDKAKEKFILGYTMEAFYTHLQDAFYLKPIGADSYGEVFEKQNGLGASVQGFTLEGRANFNRKIQFEVGYTLQNSLYDEAVEVVPGLAPEKQFLRTPNAYGYGTLSLYLPKNFTASLNAVHTGKMLIAHYAGAPEQFVNQLNQTNAFLEIGCKMAYLIKFSSARVGVEIFSGIKNLTDAYQSDFDTGKNRDSNYIYGPSAPRSFFAGLRLRSI